MKEQLISFETAKLAKDAGFDWKVRYSYGHEINPHIAYPNEDYAIPNDFNSPNKGRNWKHLYSAPTQSLLNKFIREKRGVHIFADRNASGWFWVMCRADGGTNLGYSEYEGPNYGGAWDKFEDALEHGMQVQLFTDLPEDKVDIKHWSNYAEWACAKWKNASMEL